MEWLAIALFWKRLNHNFVTLIDIVFLQHYEPSMLSKYLGGSARQKLDSVLRGTTSNPVCQST